MDNERSYEFIGCFIYNIDTKGRMAIPLSFRLVLPQESKDRLIISPGLEKTIFCFPLPEWKRFRNAILSRLSIYDDKERRILWWLSIHTSEVLIDNQGRILLQEDIRKRANLDKRVVIFGAGYKFVICSLEKYEEIKRDGDAYYEEHLKMLCNSEKLP